MKLEARLLTQCTRIFPPETKGEGKAGAAGEEENDLTGKEELEETEEETEGQSEQKMKKEGSAKTKSASYEDIIFKVGDSLVWSL